MASSNESGHRVPAPEIVLTSEHAERMHIYDAAIDFVGGVAGGTASVYIGQPLDTVKVKLQTFSTLYKSASDCFKQTLRNEGIYRGLYAGTIPSLVAQVSENAVLFVAYGFCQKAVASLCGKPNTAELTPLMNATAGGLAAFWSSLVLCPTELVKCRLQTMAQLSSPNMNSIHSKIGPWQLTSDILKQEGIPGLFRGLMPTFAREMPGYFFFFGGYEVTRYLLTPAGKTKDEIGVWRTGLSGAMGGVSLWVAVFPTDVIKSRVQVLNHTHHRGVVSTMIHIAKQEGVRALYRGLAPTVLRTIPATAGLFLAYESTKSFLSNKVYSINRDTS